MRLFWKVVCVFVVLGFLILLGWLVSNALSIFGGLGFG